MEDGQFEGAFPIEPHGYSIAMLVFQRVIFFWGFEKYENDMNRYEERRMNSFDSEAELFHMFPKVGRSSCCTQLQLLHSKTRF